MVLKELMIILLVVCLIDCSDNPVLSKSTENNTENSVEIQFPLDDYVVYNDFGVFSTGMGNEYHAAEDAEAIGGTPVYAMAKGIISYSGPMGGYGWLIIIDHPGRNVYSLYGHLSTRREKLPEGRNVAVGELIAYIADDDEDGSGSGDNPYAGYPYWEPHLHFGIREGLKNDHDASGDSRWMAGWTAAYPTDLGWLKPSEYINLQLADS
jgi:murein DD-endopeptidase MepM/ murein hydrolase activator NlpD